MFPAASGPAATIDLVTNATLMGESFRALQANNGDTGIIKPFIGVDGRSYVNKTVFNERTGKYERRALVTNAPALLPLYAYQAFDDVVVRALRFRLRATAALRAAGLEKTIPNAMGKTVLVSQNATDVGPATISMDPSRRSETDRQQLDVVNFPLYIIHKDLDFSAREIATSENTGVNGVSFQIDTEGAESAAFAVATTIDQLTLGTIGAPAYGGGALYGFLNFPQRILKIDMAVPTGANGTTTLNDILAMRQSLIAAKHFGPYTWFVNLDWVQFLDQDFKTFADQTLRQRLLATGQDGIQDIVVSDLLPTGKFQNVLVEMLPRNARVIVGFEAQTVQWRSMGDMLHHLKVMAMILTQLRPDTAGSSGIVHGQTSA